VGDEFGHVVHLNQLVPNMEPRELEGVWPNGSHVYTELRGLIAPYRGLKCSGSGFKVVPSGLIHCEDVR